MMDNPAVTLIVCTRGRTTQLSRLFESLRQQTFKDFDVLLVDQNDPGYLDDIVRSFSRYLSITHLRSAEGLSRGRNLGLKHARGRLIGFPDDDCWYSAQVIERVRAFFSEHDQTALLQTALLLGRTIDETGADSLSPFLPESAVINRENVFRSGTSNTLFVRREAALDVDGFDERLGAGATTPFASGEETDFVLRCLSAGYSARFERDFCVFHDQVSRGFHQDVARVQRYGAGFGRILRLHNYGLAYFSARIARAWLRGALLLMSGRPHDATLRFKWAMGAISGFRAPLPNSDEMPRLQSAAPIPASESKVS